MLVKQSIVEQWYCRDSWVFKNFSYIFKNPLWDKRVPQGFSVCPYFWLALFSFFILKPLFIVPITYFFAPAIKWCGKPMQMLDRGLFWIFDNLNFTDQDYHLGAGFGMSFIAIVVISLGLMGIYFGGSEYHQIYTLLMSDGSRLAVFTLWTITSASALIIILMVYNVFSQSTCNPFVYLYVWLALFLISTIVFIPTELIAGIRTVWHGSVTFGWLCISCLGWYLVLAAGGLTFVMKTVIMWTPTTHIGLPWWGYLCIASSIILISNKLTTLWEDHQINYLKENDQETFINRTKDAWVNVFVKILMTDEYWNTRRIAGLGCPSSKIYAYIYKAIYIASLKKLWATQLDVLSGNYPKLSSNFWQKINSSQSASYGGWILEEELKSQGIILNFEFDKVALAKLVDQTSSDPWIADQITIVNDIVNYKMNKSSANDQNTKDMCLIVTTAISETVQKGWENIFKFAKFTYTLLAYLWMLIVAKKKGVCPYFQFRDTNSVTPTTNK